MGIVMGVTAVILAIGCGIVGLLVWTALLFPEPTRRARTALAQQPVRCGLSGLGTTLLLGIPALLLLQAPHGGAKLAGWMLALPLASILIVGFAAMAQLLGDRMQCLSPSITPLAGLVRGAVTIELAALLPFLGWFLFAPLVGLTLIGAGARGCFSRIEPRRHEGHKVHEDDRIGKGTDGEVGSAPLAGLASIEGVVLSALCVLGAMGGYVVHGR
jgi:hypothetical protein